RYAACAPRGGPSALGDAGRLARGAHVRFLGTMAELDGARARVARASQSGWQDTGDSSHSALRSEVVPKPAPDPTLSRPLAAEGDQLDLPLRRTSRKFVLEYRRSKSARTPASRRTRFAPANLHSPSRTVTRAWTASVPWN